MTCCKAWAVPGRSLARMQCSVPVHSLILSRMHAEKPVREPASSVFTNKVRVHKDFGDEEWRRCEAEACHLRVFKTCQGEPWGPAWHHREPGSIFCKKTAFLRCPAFPHIHTLVERQEQDAVGGAQMCSSPGRKSLPLRTCFSAVRLLGEALILSFKGFILVH